MINDIAPLQLGKYNRLQVIKELDFGLYLDGFEGEEILIPRVYVPEGTEIGQFLDVFIYRDSEDRLIATTLKPLATVGEFAYLKVKDVSKLGVFLDWGLMKDLFVPFGEQLSKMAVGRSYLIYIYIDEETQRIVASAKIDKFLPEVGQVFAEKDEVELLPYEYTDLGIKALVNKCKIGIIYKNEIFKIVNLGEFTIGYIKKIREDGKLDLTLEKIGFDRIDNVKQSILSLLIAQNGFLPYTDKTDAGVIYANLQMSKKDFKKAIGGLYKEKRIFIKEDGVYIIQSE
ncbi:S1 RNA-binding domain-containing protein [Arcicella rosea]|uniref:Putative RNA-binding protein (Virulence factor B family) n=1 Tax=Arcicella rosea TaxID=502909 RepID=A0A841EYU1_9BACT|nr:S1-like domain-containing RNA-binding protein [Arcicella rosea]MBB6004661.1 putative RNA-binding protein (virulence factor B family) [Arcicella rosea]